MQSSMPYRTRRNAGRPPKRYTPSKVNVSLQTESRPIIPTPEEPLMADETQIANGADKEPLMADENQNANGADKEPLIADKNQNDVDAADRPLAANDIASSMTMLLDGFNMFKAQCLSLHESTHEQQLKTMEEMRAIQTTFKEQQRRFDQLELKVSDMQVGSVNHYPQPPPTMNNSYGDGLQRTVSAPVHFGKPSTGYVYSPHDQLNDLSNVDDSQQTIPIVSNRNYAALLRSTSGPAHFGNPPSLHDQFNEVTNDQSLPPMSATPYPPLHQQTNLDANAQPYFPASKVRSNSTWATDRALDNVKVRSSNPKTQDWFTYKIYFNTIAGKAQWDDRMKVLKLLGALDGQLAGVTSGMEDTVTYEALEQNVDSIQGIINAQRDAKLNLDVIALHDKEKETIPLFGERVRQLIDRAYPSYSLADKSQCAIDAFIKGLPKSHDFQLRMNLQEFSSFSQAVDYAAKLEHVYKVVAQNGEKKTYRKVAADDETEESAQGQLVRKMDQMVDTVNSLTGAVNKLAVSKEQGESGYRRPNKAPYKNGAGKYDNDSQKDPR